MKKNRLFVALPVICLVASTVALTDQTKAFFASIPQSQQQIKVARKPLRTDLQMLAAQQPVASEQVPYYFLFRHLVNIKNTATAIRFQTKLGLNAQQFTLLTSIALEDEREGAVLDQQAQSIITEFHRQYPPGQLPPGVAPPPPPAQLSVLQMQRNATVLRYRENLKNAFGAEAFARLDESVRSEIATSVTTNKQ